jgi:K(+)-stimulated pyrophosphate-energized sodium pump
VKSKEGDSGDAALVSVHRGFLIGSVISVVGFFAIGLFYLKFNAAYLLQYPQSAAGFPGGVDVLPYWVNLGQAGLDLRPAWTCLIGVFLAVALNKCTSYFTHTTHTPVKSMVKACQTGHATNIIQGFAVGYESTVWAVIIIAVAIGASVGIYSGTSPIFVAYGVAMCGIGMLTLTGNTISMDVFGPVADNANGIGEMGYDKAEMGEKKYKEARQILADLDSVGNTTKAETKGIAIGSAVIAAVSLFASFIAVMAMGSEEAISRMTTEQYNNVAGMLTVANPTLFIGLLIGGAVPFLFSS